MDIIQASEKNYADQWNISAQHFYDKGYYSWMAQVINEFHTVVEIGCGTGYSTLALLEAGHSVIAIDKNADCIANAQNLLRSKGFLDDRIIFVEGDITDEFFRHKIASDFSFDIVLCWNAGTYWSRQMMQFYLPYMLEYGLSREQIAANPESSYAELVIWTACKLASEKHVATHIIDRGTEIISKDNDPYYKQLKTEFGYNDISYDNRKAESISNGGRILSVNGVPTRNRLLDIILISVLLK